MSPVISSKMTSVLDTVQTYVFIESDELMETLETFFIKSWALCFAGDGLVNENEINIRKEQSIVRVK